MLRLISTCIWFMVFTFVVNANIKLSSNAQISVLTCSQGEKLYSAFGHSALRVLDTENNLDLVYNYGTFDFNTPNFYLKFAKGKLKYMLSISTFQRFLPEYYRDRRSVTEQVLNLDIKDKQLIFDALMQNYEPQNRFYKYDFFYDNCATRIFDAINDNISGELILNSESNQVSNTSFREYLHYYLKHSPWIETGLNTILGKPTDQVASLKESTFLPHFLMMVIENATIKNDEGKILPLVKNTTQLLEFEEELFTNTSVFTPIWLFASLLVLIVVWSFYSQKLKVLSNIANRFIFITIGIIGLVIAFLWFIADHQGTELNLNILWALPTFTYLGFSRWNSTFALIVLKIHVAFLLFFLLGWYWIPQNFPISTILVAIILLVRLVDIIKHNKETRVL